MYLCPPVKGIILLPDENVPNSVPVPFRLTQFYYYRMAIQTVFEKLKYNNEKNVLIQGLPSSVEKHFAKFTFSKNVTPLLRSRKIDFALLFAVSERQLADILRDVLPALHKKARLWIAHPKQTAKIASDLCRNNHWQVLEDNDLEAMERVELDTVWCATHFKLDGNPYEENNSIPRQMLMPKMEEELEEA